ncbi:SAV_6107 family HEPN domain-containing protein [Phycicoccus avicenniae]|uniref:SAV_6107 family HEPN domain-containing protein n=1 Tax=Phycicoccus avicenniae TaxID=2828860 RepID=UPI003D2BA25E
MPHAETTLDLLERSREALTRGYTDTLASARHLDATLAALRAAAALVSSRAGAAPAGNGPHDVWALAARTAPELAEWADRFAGVTGQRVGVETGLVRVSAREADDLLREAETFVDLVAARLGVPAVHPATRRLVPVRSA